MTDHSDHRRRPWPVVDRGRCTGCGWCVAACPDHLLVLEVGARRQKAAELVQPDLCPGCGKCIPVCNFRAIQLVRRTDGPPVAAHDRASECAL